MFDRGPGAQRVRAHRERRNMEIAKETWESKSIVFSKDLGNGSVRDDIAQPPND